MFTLTGQDIHDVLLNNRIRRLMPVECERLQGFPDDWTEGLSDTQRYKMCGNAITVNVVQFLGERIRGILS
jgi:site-specific DNA-cytosine methylase